MIIAFKSASIRHNESVRLFYNFLQNLQIPPHADRHRGRRSLFHQPKKLGELYAVRVRGSAQGA
jgi:hypothetical protein